MRSSNLPNARKTWTAPVLEAIDMRSTAAKTPAQNEAMCNRAANAVTGNCPNGSGTGLS